jgi:hypothetical protein
LVSHVKVSAAVLGSGRCGRACFGQSSRLAFTWRIGNAAWRRRDPCSSASGPTEYLSSIKLSKTCRVRRRPARIWSRHRWNIWRDLHRQPEETWTWLERSASSSVGLLGFLNSSGLGLSLLDAC